MKEKRMKWISAMPEVFGILPIAVSGHNERINTPDLSGLTDETTVIPLC